MTTQQPYRAHDPALPQQADVDPWSATTAAWQQTFGPARPLRPTPVRLRAYFLRHFERSGSLAEAAAHTGISPKTVRRWRATNHRFARRYDAVIQQRLEMLEDAAVHRAFSVDRRSVFHHGRAVGMIERCNDTMLMRLLARFDRIREREMAHPKVPTAVPDLKNMTSLEILHFIGWPLTPGMDVSDAIKAAHLQLIDALGEKVQEMSPSEGQATEPSAAK